MKYRGSSRVAAVAIAVVIALVGPQSAIANHVEGPRPEPQPAPAPWLRTLWGLDDTAGMLSSFTGRGVKIAVLDGPLWAGDPSVVAMDAERRLVSKDFLDGDWGDNNHGNAVVSLIADPRVGVAPGATVLHARVCAETCPAEAVAAGLRWAVREQARVVVASFGAVSDDHLVEETLRWARAKGVLVVAAAGNHGCGNCGSADRAVLPASSPDVLTIGAVAHGPAGWSATSFTAASDSVDLAGPGEGVPAVLNGGVRRFSGTSASAPIVGGVAAILLQADPTMSIDALAGALVRGAVPASAARATQPGSSLTNRAVVGAGAVDPAGSFALVAARTGDLATASPLKRPTNREPQLPPIRSHRWLGEGLEVNFTTIVNGTISLFDPSGSPLASVTANGATVMFPMPVYTDTVTWKGKWAVARNGGGYTRTFTPTSFTLATPVITSIATTEKMTKISWRKVSKAKKYAVLAGGQRIVTSSTSITLTNLTVGYPTRVQVYAMTGDNNAATMSAPSSLRYARPSVIPFAAPVIAVTRSSTGINLEVNAPTGAVVEYVRSDGGWFEITASNGRAVLQNVTALSTTATTVRVRVWLRSGFSWRPGPWSQDVALF